MSSIQKKKPVIDTNRKHSSVHGFLLQKNQFKRIRVNFNYLMIDVSVIRVYFTLCMIYSPCSVKQIHVLPVEVFSK